MSPAARMNPWDACDYPTEAVVVDCEMVLCQGNKSTLARVSCVALHSEEILLDLYCAPPTPVVDYVTRYSGIRAKDLEGAACFDEVQKRVASLVSNRPLVGHGVLGDMRVLRLLDHPPHLVVDTQDLEWGAGQRVGLKYLSIELLGQPIQRGGHSSVEDALATARLLKLHYRCKGPPPPKIVTVTVEGATTRPLPPGCETHRHGGTDGLAPPDSLTADENAKESTDTPSEGRTSMEGSPSDWTIELVWSHGAVKRLLEWWSDASELRGEADADAEAGAGAGAGAGADSDAGAYGAGTRRACGTALVFPPSLPKEHRGVLHKEAKRIGLASCASGLGAQRTIRI